MVALIDTILEIATKCPEGEKPDYSAYNWLIRTLHHNNHNCLPSTDPAGFRADLLKMKNIIGRPYESVYPETIAIQAHMTKSVIREMWMYSYHVPGQSPVDLDDLPSAIVPGLMVEALSGALVDDQGSNIYYGTEEQHIAGFDYSKADVNRGIVLKEYNHFENVVPAPDMLYFTNSPLWNAGWVNGPLIPISRSAGAANFVAPFAIFDKCCAVADASADEATRKNLKHHVQCGDFIRWYDPSTKKHSNAIVCMIRVKKMSKESARNQLVVRLNRTFELNKHDHKENETSAEKEALRNELLKKIEDTMVMNSPSVTFIVMNCYYMVGGVQPDIADKTFEAAPPDIVKAQNGKHGPPPPGMIVEIRCSQIVKVYTKMEVKVRWYNPKGDSAYLNGNYVKRSALEFAMPQSMNRHLAQKLHEFIHVEESLENGVMGEYLASTDQAENVAMDRIELNIPEGEQVNIASINQRALYSRMIKRCAETRFDIDTFKLLMRHLQIHDEDRKDKGPLPPVFRLQNWVPVQEHLETHGGRMTPAGDCGLTTDQKDRILSLYGHTDRSLPIYYQSELRDKRSCGTYHHWAIHYELENDRRIPRTRTMLLQVIDNNKNLANGESPKLIDWLGLGVAGRRSAREADPASDAIFNADENKRDREQIVIDASDSEASKTLNMNSAAAAAAAASPPKTSSLLHALASGMDEPDGEGDEDSQGDDDDHGDADQRNDAYVDDLFAQANMDESFMTGRDDDDVVDDDVEFVKNPKKSKKKGRSTTSDEDEDDVDDNRQAKKAKSDVGDTSSASRTKGRAAKRAIVDITKSIESSTSSAESTNTSKRQKKAKKSSDKERFDQLEEFHGVAQDEQNAAFPELAGITPLAQIYPGTVVGPDTGTPYAIWSDLCSDKDLPFFRFHERMMNVVRPKVCKNSKGGNMSPQKMYKFELALMSKFNPALYNVSDG